MWLWWRLEARRGVLRTGEVQGIREGGELGGPKRLASSNSRIDGARAWGTATPGHSGGAAICTAAICTNVLLSPEPQTRANILNLIADRLRPGGKLFVHVFSHKSYCYHYEDNGEDDWMTRYFFTGGTMPSHDLFAHFQDDLKLRRHWWLNGMHYANTLRKWLALMDGKKAKLRPLFEQTYGAEDTKWWNYWRVFYLACEEMFAYGDGEEWGVSHYLFENPAERKGGREGWLAGAAGGAASPGRILN